MTLTTRRHALLAGLGWPLLAALPAGCAQTPVRLACLAGLTGPASDIGVAVRDGAALAIEEAQAAGGVDGRKIEWLEFDDRQQPQALEPLVRQMVDAGVTAVIGPATSSVAQAWIPLADDHGLVSVAPTVTSHDFAGHDDHFFRICSTTREYAVRSALFAIENRQWRRFAVIRDTSNEAYTRSWADFFVAAARARGAAVTGLHTYRRPQSLDDLGSLVGRAMADRPQALVVVANAVDTSALAQLVAELPHPPALLAAEWAATDQLILRGGRSVEGLLVTQFFDRDSRTPSYVAFAERFRQRYRREPGFAEVAAFDATQVVLQALRQRQPNEDLKQTLLRTRTFEGLQNPVVFDEAGDCQRPLMVTEVRHGRFVTVA